MTTRSKHIPPLPISDITILKKLLPHRDPILLIDTLQYHDENTIQAGLTISLDSLFVKNKVFSEAGLLEHMAQCVALHTGYNGYIKDLPIRNGYIGAIKKADINMLPKAGDTIETEVVITYSAMDMTLVNIASYSQNTRIATAVMSTILAPESV